MAGWEERLGGSNGGEAGSKITQRSPPKGLSVYPWTSGPLLEGQCGMPTAAAWPNSTAVPGRGGEANSPRKTASHATLPCDSGAYLSTELKVTFTWHAASISGAPVASEPATEMLPGWADIAQLFFVIRLYSKISDSVTHMKLNKKTPGEWSI